MKFYILSIIFISINEMIFIEWLIYSINSCNIEFIIFIDWMMLIYLFKNKLNILLLIMNFNIFVFMSLMVISILLGLNANSLMFFWMSIEINMLSFIPMILFLNKNFNDTSMKYFLIQSLSSSLMLFFMMNLMNELINILFLLVFFSLLMKLGFFPFNDWYLNMLNNLSWINCLFLMTVQKILPFLMINYLFKLMNLNDYLNNNNIKDIIII